MAVYVELDKAIEIGNEVLNEGIKKFIEQLDNNPIFTMRAKMFGKSLIPPTPTVEWKKKGFGRAGTAFPSLNKIEMNLNYLQSPDAMKFIRNTMLHELAHILNGYYGGSNHDNQWKFICYLIGDDGNRCHDYRIPENSNFKKIRCKSCGKVYDVTTYRYNRYSKYRCKCHGELEQI
jgi:predicted SprT family Zn-dependent metalloprotease